ELAGKVAIVTGSARNIGRATAIELARAGASVTINAVKAVDLCEELADEIRSMGGDAIAVPCDVTREEDARYLVEQTVEVHGGLDILVSNAALRNNTPFEEMTFANWTSVLSVALNGAFLTCSAAVPHMIARGGGSIIGLGGMAANKGAPGRSHVMASKGGLAAFMRGLALDLGKHNIRANTIGVGTIDTDREGASSPGGTHMPNIPLGRKGTPQDLANLARFLAGPRAGYITGQTIQCTGGAYFGV
ncbi:MAG: SDR family NAD(P)-dependent oxidoreductase, partial [Acetobacterales bacterium]